LLAEAGDGRTPTCVTCHGLAVSTQPTPAEMEHQCAACHRPGSPRASYPAAARELLEAMASLRSSASALETLIGSTDDSTRRVELTTTRLALQARIKEASVAFHEFRPAALAAALATLRPHLSNNAESRAPRGRQ
jgi:hypothetical protein